MKKNYVSPELEKIFFLTEDILDDSNTGGLIQGGSEEEGDESTFQPFG